MLKIFAYLTKKAGLEPEAFVDYYENHHVPWSSAWRPLPRSTNATTSCAPTS
jgi:hypothetical protein